MAKYNLVFEKTLQPAPVVGRRKALLFRQDAWLFLTKPRDPALFCVEFSLQSFACSGDIF